MSYLGLPPVHSKFRGNPSKPLGAMEIFRLINRVVAMENNLGLKTSRRPTKYQLDGLCSLRGTG